ncbi:MAG: hypothetical protein O7G84_01165 [Gammaproteobacteria bacterium]|nr:hypothetical protein [Gammaproteobacteria bacterium]
MPGTQTPEDGVTPESLGASLDELVKAAAATDLLKGGATVDANRVESSGRVEGEDAKTATVTGGGRAPVPKAMDSMMIGKLADLGFDAGDIAAMAGALTGKAKDDEEEEDDSMEGYVGKMTAHAKGYADKNGGSMKGYMGYPGAHDVTPKMDKAGTVGGEPLAKAMDAYNADPDMGPLLDGTDFFAGFVKTTADQLDGVNATLKKGFGNQEHVNAAMAGAIHQTGTLIKSQSGIIEALGERLGLVERQPQQPRGATSASAAATLAKSMPGEAGAGGGEPLKKHEILSTLSYMNLEKGMREIGGERTAQIIGLLEGGNQCSEQALAAVNDFLMANPTEVQAARTYQ